MGRICQGHPIGLRQGLPQGFEDGRRASAEHSHQVSDKRFVIAHYLAHSAQFVERAEPGRDGARGLAGYNQRMPQRRLAEGLSQVGVETIGAQSVGVELGVGRDSQHGRGGSDRVGVLAQADGHGRTIEAG